MSNPIVEQCLRQKLNSIQAAADQISQEREQLWINERTVRDQIRNLIGNQMNELRTREGQLLDELNARIKEQEARIQQKQQNLVDAMAIYHHALNSIHTGNGQQINEAMLKLNSLKLESAELEQLELETSQAQCKNDIHFLGQIKTVSDKATYSWSHDDLSVSDDDFEIVDETDSTTIGTSSLDSIREAQQQKVEPPNPSFQEHVQKVLDSPAQKWLLNATSHANLAERKPLKLNKILKHKLECQKKSPKISQPFDEVIRSIQRSPNTKWLREFQASCPDAVQNISAVFGRLMKEDSPKQWLHQQTAYPTPLIMHHV